MEGSSIQVTYCSIPRKTNGSNNNTRTVDASLSDKYTKY